MDKNNKNKRVIVAMSGGIDSSVAAALLKQQGYNIIGVFMKFWPQGGRCCSTESEKRARFVAKKLGIPFYVFNFEKEFKKKVVDYFLKNSKLGLTPNPCVVCNKEIKFKLLFKKLKSLEADYIATGHYARLWQGKLLKAKDKNKDQSYFLWKLDQKILRKTLFPIGDYTKPEIRSLAKKFKLSFEDVPESQEICFVQNSINDFLKKYLKTKPGLIINKSSLVLGQHQGLWFYTIGQRKGIGLAGGPYYVLDKDLKKNVLIITNIEKDLLKKELIVKNLNWISGKAPKFPFKAMVGIRYGHKPASAFMSRAYMSRAHLKIRFFKLQKAVTPGQSAVFFLPAGKAGEKNELLGGGIII
jgi:tRNA-specific 2-thiouridylase